VRLAEAVDHDVGGLEVAVEHAAVVRRLHASGAVQICVVEHALCFAFVDFLLQSQGGAKFRDFLRLVKKETPTRDALQQAFGYTPLTIDEAFRQWVKEHYSLLPG
jgi:hypothetical protein